MTRTINIATLSLAKGAHRTPDDGLCLLEAVAYVAGEAHTDHPACVSPILGVFGGKLNDCLDDAERQQLKPLIPRLPGTAGDGLDEARGYLALDWLVRTYTPAWLELAGLSVEGAELRALRRIVDLATAQEARPAVQAAAEKSHATWIATLDADRDAGRDAVWDAVRAVTLDVAQGDGQDAALGAVRGDIPSGVLDVALSATWVAAWDAARVAAWVAARSGPWDAAWVAARNALDPTVLRLQDSAIALFVQMINPR